MWELIAIGGWVMLPIIACSIIAVAIVMERLWVLRPQRIAPGGLVPDLWRDYTLGGVDEARLQALRAGCPLERILATVLLAADTDPQRLRERVEEAGRAEAHGLDRNLNTLGTIASVAPLLGLLGTVIGMIEVFSALELERSGDASALAGGIGQALVTTAAGLCIAIPALIAHRYLRGQVQGLVQSLEQNARKLIDLIERNRRPQ